LCVLGVFVCVGCVCVCLWVLGVFVGVGCSKSLSSLSTGQTIKQYVPHFSNFHEFY